MFFAPTPLSSAISDRDVLISDRRQCLRFGPCGVGREALYLNGRFIDRRFYIPWREISCVFKRVAMSKNGFTGKGVFGSLPFLVVQYGKGEEREFPFKAETDVDRLLAEVAKSHPAIPTHSAAARKKLAEARRAEEARYLKKLPAEVTDAVNRLKEEQNYLERRPDIGDRLTAAARQKRIADNMSPAYRAGGLVFAILSALALLAGLLGLLRGSAAAPYLLLIGAAVFFMVLSSNALPGKYNSRSYAQKEWESAADEARQYLAGRPDFPVPPQYAHPIVLTRMIRVLREGRAATAAGALAVVKADLKALNASVTVSQQEHDEVAAVKCLFLACDYRDEL